MLVMLCLLSVEAVGTIAFVLAEQTGNVKGRAEASSFMAPQERCEIGRIPQTPMAATSSKTADDIML
eukprot:CAMPEP_0113666306 /NCGR_PEP_ID=MMETSP0038_2-20120614/2799_1 /TAXON_ID=2898 /ORGANISM="Cryptomonas paramecium" /LENGTH=66 /DNA_ID=CAMNT_0000581779 /DNA_START=572 /DNA_END=772 /DNA_ORIENTATION=- /assembly_acc=CAM_ASM_000170